MSQVICQARSTIGSTATSSPSDGATGAPSMAWGSGAACRVVLLSGRPGVVVAIAHDPNEIGHHRGHPVGVSDLAQRMLELVGGVEEEGPLDRLAQITDLDRVAHAEFCQAADPAEATRPTEAARVWVRRGRSAGDDPCGRCLGTVVSRRRVVHCLIDMGRHGSTPPRCTARTSSWRGEETAALTGRLRAGV
jgi:hypothetical protein